MKKIIIIAFTFSFFITNAQDTIIFKNNNATVLCKIRSVTQTNIFYIVNGEYLSDYLSNVKYYSRPNTQVKPINSISQPNKPAEPSKHDIFNPTGYMALSIGVGFPLGKYKDSGYASNGLNLSFSAAKPFSGSKFGVALKIDYGNNPVDAAALNSNFQNNSTNNGISTEIGSVGNFSYITTLAGFCEIFADKDYSFELRVLGGFMFANIPSLDINVFDNNNFVGDISQPAASATSFCFNLGAGFRYKILPELSAIANFDFEYSKPEFSVTATAVVQNGGGSQSISSSGNVYQVFELGNLTFGLAWTPLKTSSK